MIRRFCLFTILVVLATPGVGADEFKLKDGSKIDGTIVGFQGNSFRVKTSYGFAVVRKDQIVSIRVSDAANAPAKNGIEAKKTSAPKAVAQTATARASSDASGKPSAATMSAPASAAVKTPPAKDNVAVQQPAPTITQEHSLESATIPPPSVAAAPVVPVAPAVIRERVDGNMYINDTYSFSMYKPPDWNLVAGARTLLPGAITALGTDDQATYLLIGEEPAEKSIEAQMSSTVDRLAGIMDNFQPRAETRLSVSGGTAIERRFRGNVDQHDWSGVVVLIPRGPIVFTIFGMTYAETDLVQIQENVIARTIASIQFAQAN